MKKQLGMHSQIRIKNVSIERSAGKNLFVLECLIITGGVQVGLNMSLPYSSGIDMTIPIDQVEVIEAQRMKIKVHCDDQEELEFLLGLNLDGEVLIVE
jgi:hypothetical protein